MLCKDEFLKKYSLNKTFDDISLCNEISWDMFERIYNDFIKRNSEIENAAKALNSLFLYPIHPVNQIHSVKFRIKDGEHLIAKIIRNLKDNYNKYKYINDNNYLYLITDIIGIRILTKYKADWEKVHDFILENFTNDEANYITLNPPFFNYVDNPNKQVIVETPKAYLRHGDPSIFKDKILQNYTSKGYRSVHYIVKFKNIYCEIQLRTLAEEIYGEFDHDVRYPDHQADMFLINYTMRVSEMTSMIDGLMSMFNDLPKAVIKSCCDSYAGVVVYPDYTINSKDTTHIKQSKEIERMYKNGSTAKDIANGIITRKV